MRWLLLVVAYIAIGAALMSVPSGTKPTADQMYGCTVAQQTASGECK